MIGLDTNVLVRYVLQDDARQSPRASRLIESLSVDEPGFVPVVTLIELAWVLGAGYKLPRVQLAAVRKENRELARTNDILRAAASFFGAELDRQSKK